MACFTLGKELYDLVQGDARRVWLNVAGQSSLESLRVYEFSIEKGLNYLTRPEYWNTLYTRT